MRKTQKYLLKDVKTFKVKVGAWANSFSRVCYLESNGWQSTFDCLVGIGQIGELFSSEDASFESLKAFNENKKDWLFGYFSYDLKNEIEALHSENQDSLRFPELHFFQPRYVFIVQNKTLIIAYLEEHDSKGNIDEIFEKIKNGNEKSEMKRVKYPELNINIKPRVTKEEYIDTVLKIKSHIRKGDIYEMNFCQEFYAEEIKINSIDIYFKLNEISKAPFSAFYRLEDKYILCGSPERFLKKKGRKIISQPIKGTIRRGKTPLEDAALKLQLYEDPKERSENVMIVDLVRNDLSRTAAKGSVKVEELFGIYSFEQVHQMISTVSAEIKEGIHFIDVIKNAFPMGSMTGAPKIKAMELIEKYGRTKRGVYSGAMGYITPDGNFDFNVLIRSIVYNTSNKYLSFMVGSAITDKSDPWQEYEECLLKAKAMREALNAEFRIQNSEFRM